MSWQDILDVSLLRSGKIAQAAIVGQDGEVWAESAGCNMTDTERSALMQGFDVGTGAAGTGAATVTGGPRSDGSGFAREIWVGGRRYATTMGCLDMMLAKRKEGGGGCVVKKTGQSVIVAEYVHNGDAMTALALVERLADYLISQGY